MSMYKIQLVIVNPMGSKTDGSADSERLLYQFDPTTMTAAKWAAAFPAVQASVNTLVTRSAPEEPATW